MVVYVSAGDQPAPAPAETVRYDQKGCEYMPHVAALQAGQPLEIYNDDQTSHNIHPLAKVNPEWNKSQPPGTPPIKATYDKPEFIAVKCNVHPWMHGYFAVLSTSHFAVTGDDGTFTHHGPAAGQVHDHGLAREVRHAEPGGDRRPRAERPPRTSSSRRCRTEPAASPGATNRVVRHGGGATRADSLLHSDHAEAKHRG